MAVACFSYLQHGVACYVTVSA